MAKLELIKLLAHLSTFTDRPPNLQLDCMEIETERFNPPNSVQGRPFPLFIFKLIRNPHPLSSCRHGRGDGLVAAGGKARQTRSVRELLRVCTMVVAIYDYGLSFKQQH